MANTDSAGADAGARPLRADSTVRAPLPPEQSTGDPSLVRTEVPRDTADNESLRSTRVLRTERAQYLRDNYGGFYWGADFLGFAVAIFFTVLLLGIVGAVVGAVGYQLNAPVPKIGGALTNTTQNLGIGALAGSLVALFLAYFLGGYAAGRMARYDGAKNGLGVVIWTVIVAIILGIAGGVLGNRFNVASQLHLKIDTQTLTTAGVLSLAVTLLIMIVAAMFGGSIGERYHRRIDRDAGVTR